MLASLHARFHSRSLHAGDRDTKHCRFVLQEVELNERQPRILVAEDEIAIALEIEAHLQDAGYATVGPASDGAEIGTLTASGPIDAAVIDVGMVGAASDFIARMIEDGIPCVFMTGYQDADLPLWLPDGERLTKPFHMPDLVERVAAMLRTGAPIGTKRELSA
jgi:DNA-binding response OmpR family regulator